ncbi:hypothetical protein Q8W71_23000 [Methylobacterium sp. NEAU 140]|uniref:hypothetical protein n=1 Tax=Methylobacterium sp. NEAU 140 TaxID=3064945 RepID=UPI0027339C63|nr:hypothetical protein [Methylobacterium sp. NEAU 140]MDP4025506.1 hypothetical protein [Methylobacterium sp. NEAU 140]
MVISVFRVKTTGMRCHRSLQIRDENHFNGSYYVLISAHHAECTRMIAAVLAGFWSAPRDGACYETVADGIPRPTPTDPMRLATMTSTPTRRATAALVLTAALAQAVPPAALAQTVEDGSEAAIGAADTRTVLDLIARNLNSPDAKVSALRRGGGGVICGSVNVKNRDGLYTGERGFLVDLAAGSFGRVPDGPELLDPRVKGFAQQERVRQQYFAACLD